MIKLNELLRGNFWIIPVNCISDEWLEFLETFFYVDIHKKEEFDEDEGVIRERKFIVLNKREQYIYRETGY